MDPYRNIPKCVCVVMCVHCQLSQPSTILYDNTYTRHGSCFQIRCCQQKPTKFPQGKDYDSLFHLKGRGEEGRWGGKLPVNNALRLPSSEDFVLCDSHGMLIGTALALLSNVNQF